MEGNRRANNATLRLDAREKQVEFQDVHARDRTEDTEVNARVHGNPRDEPDGGTQWFPPSSPMKPRRRWQENFQNSTCYTWLERSHYVEHGSMII